jgi:hypothetical protein
LNGHSTEKSVFMKLQIVCVVILFGILAPPAFGQRRAPVRSPEIDVDGKVTFRLQAANADGVEVAGQWPEGHVPMTKGENDVWQVTVDLVPPGVWEYSFRVDGVSMIDPGNPAIKPMRSPRTSIIHLPGEPALLHDFQDVPHGTVHLHTYRSKSLGRLRELAVYTPPGYQQDQAVEQRTSPQVLQNHCKRETGYQRNE